MKARPEDLQSLYRARFGELGPHRLRVWTVLNQHWFQRMIPRNGTVLDLGCGWGEFINTIDAAKRHAMDLNPDTATYLDRAVTLHAQDCSDPWPFEDGALDVVFTSNFLEHLPHKEALSSTMREAARCLKSGGALICLGPNVRYLPAYWDFYDHHIPLSERSLSECIEGCGLVVEQAIPRFLPFTMSDREPAPDWVIRLYLRLRFAWPMFGKQFLVVARKPA